MKKIFNVEEVKQELAGAIKEVFNPKYDSKEIYDMLETSEVISGVYEIYPTYYGVIELYGIPIDFAAHYSNPSEYGGHPDGVIRPKSTQFYFQLSGQCIEKKDEDRAEELIDAINFYFGKEIINTCVTEQDILILVLASLELNDLNDIRITIAENVRKLHEDEVAPLVKELLLLCSKDYCY